MENRHRCDCCGHYTLLGDADDILWDICPVCFWENDVKGDDPMEYSGANHMTLQEGRDHYQRYAACDPAMLCHVRKPRNEELAEQQSNQPMLLSLIVHLLLWQAGFTQGKEYNDLLDTHFLQQPQNPRLLDLECCSQDAKESLKQLQPSLVLFDQDTAFGRILFQQLAVIYKSEAMTIEAFGEHAYQLWQLLPDSLSNSEPFWTLSYADDCLSHGDAAQTKALYEAAFQFYDGAS